MTIGAGIAVAGIALAVALVVAMLITVRVIEKDDEL